MNTLSTEQMSSTGRTPSATRAGFGVIRHGLVAVAVAAGLLVAGCAGQTSIQPDWLRSGIASSFRYAAAQGPLPVVVVGNPYPASDTEVAETIANALPGTYGGVLARFKAAPASAAPSPEGHRIVWHLSAPRALSPTALCDGSPAPGAGMATRPDWIIGAFCAGNLTLATANVHFLEPVTGPADPAWRQAFRDALDAMIPLVDPFEDLDL